jgi:hypothetical protein
VYVQGESLKTGAAPLVEASKLPDHQDGEWPAWHGFARRSMTEVSWRGTSGGDWSTKADWVGGAVPTASDDAVIDAAGKYAVTITSADAARSLTVNDAGATVTIGSGGSLSLLGALAVQAGTVQLDTGGTINGGVLSATGGGFNWIGGTLDGVTYEGTLNLSAGGDVLESGPTD